MDAAESERLVDALEDFISRCGDVAVVPRTALPCSPGRLRHALLSHLEHLVGQGQLDEERLDALAEYYGFLAYVVDADEASRLNDDHRRRCAGEVIEGDFDSVRRLKHSLDLKEEFKQFRAELESRQRCGDQ